MEGDVISYCTAKRRYWNLKVEVADRTLWRTRFGRGDRPVARQTTQRMAKEKL